MSDLPVSSCIDMIYAVMLRTSPHSPYNTVIEGDTTLEVADPAIVVAGSVTTSSSCPLSHVASITTRSSHSSICRDWYCASYCRFSWCDGMVDGRARNCGRRLLWRFGCEWRVPNCFTRTVQCYSADTLSALKTVRGRLWIKSAANDSLGHLRSIGGMTFPLWSMSVGQR